MIPEVLLPRTNCKKLNPKYNSVLNDRSSMQRCKCWWKSLSEKQWLVTKIGNKKTSSTEVRTQAKGFKVPCANHYTIELLSDSLPNLFFKTFWLINFWLLIIEPIIINWHSITYLYYSQLTLCILFLCARWGIHPTIPYCPQSI